MSPTDAPTPLGQEAVHTIARAGALDTPAEFIAAKVRELVPEGPVKDVLDGSVIGHALHPLLTDLPIGTWTSALLLDWLGGSDSEGAADRLIALGLAAAAPTFASGWVEYANADRSDAVRRVGIVHALANGGGAALMATSLAARRNGARGRGKLLALAGGALMGAGAFLGGHLSFGEGVGVGPRSPGEGQHPH